MASKGGKRPGSGRKVGSPNKVTSEIRALAGEHADEAIRTLVDLMSRNETPAAARISAAKELLERGYGKSGNFATLALDTPLSEIAPAEALGLIADHVTDGDLAIDEGVKLTGIIESRIKAVEVAELETRLKALEAK